MTDNERPPPSDPATLLTAATRLSEHVPNTDAGLAAGVQLGPYRLLKPLGRGGMGTVWLAERADGLYSARVAMKMLHPWLLQPSVRERFAREGRTLARLAHPNIARLLDAGVADSRLYLVLEYVQGERLDQWCNARSLGIEARIRLLLDVCAAVSAAHAALVVHRDLKPSNILVSDADGVKLLDFGIAKLIEADGTDTELTELSRVSGSPFTLEYAAPEQIAEGLVTTATDVHALGVMLYLLLCGQRPFGIAATTSAEIRHAILHDEARPPSRALSDTAASLRGVSAGTLCKALAGDLDTIVAKALQKRPTERYGSVAEFAEDLRRHLELRPIRARPESLRYRFAKYVRRNRIGVTAAAALTIAVVAGVVGVGWQAARADAQRQRAERVKDYVVSIFRQQDPFARADRDARTPTELLGAAVTRLDTELVGEPALRAELLHDLGGIFASLGAADRALPPLEQALALREQQFGVDSLEVAQTLTSLIVPSLQMRNRDRAEQFARRAVAIIAADRGASTLDLARAELELARAISFGTAAPEEALALNRSAQRHFEHSLGPDAVETLGAMHQETMMLEQVRDDVRARARLVDLIARTERRYGAASAPLVTALSILGRITIRAGHYSEAEAALRRADAIHLSAIGATGDRLASVRVSLANLLREQRRFGESLEAFKSAEAALAGSDVSNRSDVLRGRGRVELKLGDAAAAERSLRAAYDAERGRSGDGSGRTWYFAAEWGRALSAQKRIREAETIQRTAVTRIRELMGEDAYQNVFALSALADTLEASERREAAEPLRRRAHALTSARYPAPHKLNSVYAVPLAINLLGSSKPADLAEGLAVIAEALTGFRDQPDTVGDYAVSLAVKAQLLAAADRRDEAIAAALESRRLLSSQSSPDPEDLARAEAVLKRFGTVPTGSTVP